MKSNKKFLPVLKGQFDVPEASAELPHVVERGGSVPEGQAQLGPEAGGAHRALGVKPGRSWNKTIDIILRAKNHCSVLHFY